MLREETTLVIRHCTLCRLVLSAGTLSTGGETDPDNVTNVFRLVRLKCLCILLSLSFSLPISILATILY